MASLTLFEQGNHRNVLLEDFGSGLAVQANQHLIVHGDRALLLDPGGHKIYSKARSEVNALLKGTRLTDIFLSHQDPDIVAALNGWLMTSDAQAHVPALWIRFVAHFGIDSLVESRIVPIPDRGRRLDLGDSAQSERHEERATASGRAKPGASSGPCELILLPAHFLHSCGNYHVYDPIARILYSGDLGGSFGINYRKVEDFDRHIGTMLGFHERVMASGVALKRWAKLVRTLDVQTIAPQHGAYFEGPEMVGRFLDWIETLECGLDHLDLLSGLPA